MTFPLLARKLGTDITHGQYGISPLCKNGISTVHDVSFRVNPSWFSSKDAILLNSGVGISARTAKRIITVSDTSKGEVIHYFPAAKDKVRVAHNACPPWIQPVQGNQIVHALGIPDEYLLTVGTNWARKNMKLAVDATKDLGVKLVVTGKQGGEIGASHVIPTGYVDTETLSALYSGAKMTLAPSLHEGFGITLLESMRCGSPVLCGPGGAMPEVAGTAAFLMPDYDPVTWATAIGKLLRDPSKLSELAAKGIEREREFTWAQSAQAHYDVYRELN